MSDFSAGESVYLDRSLRVEFVRETPDGLNAIVRVGLDSRLVALTSLSRLEA